MSNPDVFAETMLPRGVKDFLPIKAAKIGYLQQTLLEVFGRWGFRPIVPPSLEYLQSLEKGLGEGLREKTFRFDDRQSGRLVAIPPDITPQVARIVATRMRDIPLPLRLFYSGRVLRHAEQQTGKDREIFQAGVELIGLESPEADAEMIAMAVECLKTLGSGLAALLATLPLTDRVREEILVLPRLFGGREVLERAERAVSNDRSRRALANLVRTLEILEVFDVEEHVTFDLGELRGLDYHSGVTFQGFLSGVGRAVCSGGRYDNLTGRYGYPAPATGFAFNLLNLLFALDRQLDERASLSTDVLIFQAGNDKRLAQRLAVALRQQGCSAARDIIPRGLEATLEYARKMNFRHILVLGEESGEHLLIRIADGGERRVGSRELLSGHFTL